MTDATPGGVSAGAPLTDDELATMVRLLARFSEHHLDQFELLKLLVPPFGVTYVEIKLEKSPGTGEAAYAAAWPPPAPSA